jgi:hypothetical protein
MTKGTVEVWVAPEIGMDVMAAVVAGGEKGRMAQSNAEQVAKMVRVTKELGIEPVTPDEARQILGLKGIANVNY